MLKPLAAASVILLVFSAQANARPQHRHHGHRAWCGSYLSKYLGKSDRRLALARSWANEGMNAGGPGIGVVVVWRHHVGIITGQTPDGQWSFTAATTAARCARAPDRLPARLRSDACSRCEIAGWAKARQRRAHHLSSRALFDGGHACAFPTYGLRTDLLLPASAILDVQLRQDNSKGKSILIFRNRVKPGIKKYSA
jgi:hypothetical protein